MKNAHVEVSCSLFRKLIMDFIDGELSEKVRPDFLAHSLSCPECRKELKELQYVKKVLAGCAPVSVSSEFDFRLKASLRLEEVRLRSPMYRLSLFLRDNVVSVVGTPVAAAVLLGGVLLYNGPFQAEHPGMQSARKAPVAQEWVRNSTINGSPAEDIHYVLDSVELSEVGTSVKATRKNGSEPSGANSINLIRY